MSKEKPEAKREERMEQSITILRVPNPDGPSKMIIFLHEEGLGEFREKLRKASAGALVKKYVGLGPSVPCWDELFADVQSDFRANLPCRWQILDYDLLIRNQVRPTVTIIPKGEGR